MKNLIGTDKGYLVYSRVENMADFFARNYFAP